MGILVTRPYVQALETAEILNAYGFSVSVAPLLDVEPVQHERIRWADVDVVIFTSVNAVRFVSTIAAGVDCVCVGDATAAAARQKGFQRVHACDGDVQSLMAHIRKTYPLTTRFLYVSGNETCIDLPLELETYAIQRVIVYRAIKRQAFAPQTVELFQAGQLRKVTLFSKRTAQAFVHCVNNAKIHLSGVKLYCLSAAVAQPCQALIAQAIRVAARPTQQAMINLIREEQ